MSVCKCGKGYASEFDGMCKFCREFTVRRAEAKKVGVKHRGDGMTIEQWAKLKKCSPHVFTSKKDK